MTEAMPFLQNYDITFLRPPPIRRVFLFAFFLKICFHLGAAMLKYN